MNTELARFIEYLPKGATILDLGAGKGETAAELTLKGYKIIALDNNPEVLATLNQLPGIQIISATLPSIPLIKPIDAVWCANTLPWLTAEAQQATIHAASNLLKPNGIFYCSTRSPDPRRKASMLTPLHEETTTQALTQAGLALLDHYPDQQDTKWHHWFARKK
jgi:SAM-dependent methyltransferase